MHLLFEFNCNRRATGMQVQLQQKCLLYMSQHLRTWGTATGLSVWQSCYRHTCLVLDLCVGPVPHSQTCVMVNVSADLCNDAWAGGWEKVEQPGTLAGNDLNRQDC